MSEFDAGLPNRDTPIVGAPRYTWQLAGTGNFIPQAGTTWLKVTLLGGGAGGNSTSGATSCSGGNAAIPVTYWIQNTKSSYAYAVGAAGNGAAGGPGGAGSDTTFDTLTGYGALSPNANPYSYGETHGMSSPYGKGGAYPSVSASGFGAGGGGTGGGGATGGNGSPGTIFVEEY